MKRVTRRSGNILADADDHDMKARLGLGIAKLGISRQTCPNT